ncbi:MAG: sensor histidine kinase [Cyclobacteriaceae bacterium]
MSLRSIAQKDNAIEQIKSQINASSDTTKAELMLDLSFEFIRISADSVIYYAKRAMAESERQGYQPGLAQAWYYLGSGYILAGNYADALDSFNKCLSVSKQIENLKLQANAHNGLGRAYFYLGEFPSAIDNYLRCITLREAIKDSKGLAVASGNLGLAYQKFDDDDKAEFYLNQALHINRSAKDTLNIITDLINLGVLYENSSRFETAVETYEEGIMLAELFNDEVGVAIMTGNLGTVYSKQGNHDKAFELINRSITLKEKSGRPVSMAYARYHNQAAYYRAGYYDRSIAEGEIVLNIVEEHPSTELAMNAYEFLDLAYAKKNDMSRAYVYRTKFENLKDSIFNIEKSEQVARLQTLYEKEKQDRVIELNEIEIATLETKNTLQRQTAIFIVMGLILLFGIAYLVRSNIFVNRARRLQEQFSQQLLSYQEQERERLSRDLHDSVGQSLILIKNRVNLTDDVDTSNLVANTLDEVRDISKKLHPMLLEKLGLTSAIKKLVDEIDANTNIFIESEIDDLTDIFSKDDQLHIYRIMQEAINNMVKHSETKSASIDVTIKEDKITFTVEDHGKGFDLIEQPGQFQSLGMLTLKERTKILKGKLTIDSTKGKGTKISLTIDKKNLATT